ncbi:SDR family NAD(P)-dependent oxidoreductase [Schlesneria sp. T3-172]|uniref:SDR family NAD(P)-dependent oxidoreductase n=1 Tax=Schlesneria sphaerica TaxID=3373610 RepID=UPI0037C4F473
MKELRGRTALITGASRGIGMLVAKELAREGMNLALAARSADKLEQLATELRSLGIKVVPVETDVAKEDDLRRLVETTMSELGSIDVLVNNAGIEAFQPFQVIDPQDITQTIQTNLTASLLLTRFVLPHMLKNGRGHIVNMASTAGKFGPAFGAAYGASKAGLIAFTQSLRGELYKTGVSASAICPGFADNGGIYEVIKDRTGKRIPWYVGSTSAEKVARVVVRAIRNDRPDMIVNFPALRPVFTLNQALPSLGEWIVRVTTRRFLKQAATRG